MNRWKDFLKYLKKHYVLYLLLVLPILYYIIFCYIPMGGLLMAFQDYNVRDGLLGSEWVGLGVFKNVLASSKFWRAFGNTLKLNILSLVIGFPAPIILALFLNEIKSGFFKKTVQTILYLPHFLSWVMIGGMAILFFATNEGMINLLLASLGFEKIPFLTDPDTWVGTYVCIGIWQSIGWGSIVYLSAITGIDQEQYDAARVDGCNRFKMMYLITIPNIIPTIVIMLILNVGGMASISLDRPLMLGNAMVRSASEVISTYAYTMGIEQGNFSRATAIGLFQSVINFILLVSTNKISKKLSGESLW